MRGLPRTGCGVGAGSREKTHQNKRLEPPFQFNRNAGLYAAGMGRAPVERCQARLFCVGNNLIWDTKFLNLDH